MNYRDVYRINFGDIPKDELGRSFDIHHKDGNRKNNNPNNLVAVSIQEHYDIHYNRGDFNACFLIAKRMDKSESQLLELRNLSSKFMTDNNPSSKAKGSNHWSRNTVVVSDKSGNKFRVSKDDPRLGNELEAVNKGQITVRDKDGKCFNVYRDDPRYISGELKHNTAGLILKCPHCNKTGGNTMKRWHFNNCRHK